MSESELKPCPFCGGPLLLRVFSVDIKDAPVERGAECEGCNLSVRAWDGESDSELIERVNTRTPSTDTIPRAWWEEVKQFFADNIEYIAYRASLARMQEIESRGKDESV